MADRKEWGEEEEEVEEDKADSGLSEGMWGVGRDEIEKGCLSMEDAQRVSHSSGDLDSMQVKDGGTHHSPLPNPFPTKESITQLPASQLTPSATCTVIRIARSSRISTVAIAGPVEARSSRVEEVGLDRRWASRGAM